MKIARIATETAELPSYEGVIDGCPRVHWRRPAIFPVAGGGERQFISAQIAERRSIRVSPKKLLFGGPPSAGGLFRRESLYYLRQCVPQGGGHTRRSYGIWWLSLLLICWRWFVVSR